MSKLLHIITKEKNVDKAKALIKAFSLMQSESYIEAYQKGYTPDKQVFKPTCKWENADKDGNEVILKYTLEIFES